ncbi:hypothetical protein TRIUR3_27044 [Triticum urartu]|uniref:Uncharacterized protein n=1 Tax=Triticum urartu TaxID=4572 RepID=M8A872_TRIUA|nr:hypothetical protein TRIUR3_27044 [Triticum urartu]
MASEDVVGKSRGDTAVNTIVNLAEEAKLAREGVKGPAHGCLQHTKVEKAEFFYERGNFLANFLSAPATSASAASASCCPVMRGD